MQSNRYPHCISLHAGLLDRQRTISVAPCQASIGGGDLAVGEQSVEDDGAKDLGGWLVSGHRNHLSKHHLRGGDRGVTHLLLVKRGKAVPLPHK